MDLTKKEIIKHLKAPSNELFDHANQTRKTYVGDEIHLRGLIEISNICQKNCCYCGIRASNTNCIRYKLTPNDIISLAQKAKGLGLQTIVLQGGENNLYNIEQMTYIIEEIKKLDLESWRKAKRRIRSL